MLKVSAFRKRLAKWLFSKKSTHSISVESCKDPLSIDGEECEFGMDQTARTAFAPCSPQ